MQNEYGTAYFHLTGSNLIMLNPLLHVLNVLDADSITIVLSIALALTNLVLVLYFARLSYNLYVAYKAGANGLTLTMVYLYASLCLLFLLSLITNIIASPFFNIYEVSWTRVTLLAFNVFLRGLVVLSCWHFDMALFRIAVQEASDNEKTNTPGNN